MTASWRQRLPRWLGGLPGKGAQLTPGPANTLDLRFANGVAQSRMRLDAPDLLVVDYTRTMLAALLWQSSPKRIGIVGLGGGSQAKFLYEHLPLAEIEALEINRDVLACRERFQVPHDDARFHVLHCDAADFLPAHPGRYDLLLVDAYDETGIPTAVSTPEFHHACRASLTPSGVLASNLYCKDHAAHFARLQQAFDGRAVLVEEPRQSNRVAFAWKAGGSPRVHPADEVLSRLPPQAAMQLRDGFRRVEAAVSNAGKAST